MKIYSLFSSKSLIVLTFTFMHLIVLSEYFIQCEVRVQLLPFVCCYPIVSVPSTEKTVLSRLDCLGILLKINCLLM